MATNVQMENKVDALDLGFRGYEEEAIFIFEEAQRAAALIPGDEFEEVFDAAPPLAFHHRYVQSLLTWIWYEVHEMEVPLENLPLPLAVFFQKYEAPFATFWQ
jgi:hypothetical protein